MRVTNVLLLATTASAISFPDVSSITSLFARKNGGDGGNKQCPAVWSSVSTTLTAKFLENGQCNKFARAAIRAVFHDCGAWKTTLGATAGCDGSLVFETGRDENNGLQEIVGYLQGLASQFQVSVADMIVFAGNHAIVTCPGGSRVKTWIGRTPATAAGPGGLLPPVTDSAANLSALFIAKGFDDRELAALLGAHTTSTQDFVDPAKAGQAQDSTPGIWDVKYYAQTLNPPQGVFVFPSDTKLANYGNVGKEFKGFVDNQGKWSGKFADAMGKMTLFGSAGTSNMADCTDSLPKSTNIKREMKALPMFAPRN
ncbi:versatile peroxidase VPL1 [Polyplosphaeria fusca]|uniref:Peroxidase n=1 Tax=Polyplosphaeria fusca TaxID=682080 RepID=A0A9P4QZL1_9PLEO|nr:versatile peroxidase VPL1 [Polyplosphaeria fusca]